MPARILVMEDDPAFRYAAAKALEGAGFSVVAAADSMQAIAILNGTEHLDLLMVDLVIPKGVNGFAVARMAKLRRPQIKILYLTAYELPVHEALGKVLRKPIGDEALIAAVHEALAD